ncbi:hypothetical protein H5410_021383, partial [Solanum commersonii]
NAFERVIELNKRHQYSYISLLEPFQIPSELEQYRRKLGSSDTTQQLTMNLRICGTKNKFVVTAVYGRCSGLERLELLEDFECMEKIIRHFKLLNFRIKHADFQKVVEESRRIKLEGSHFRTIDLKRFMRIEEDFWKQKAGMR